MKIDFLSVVSDNFHRCEHLLVRNEQLRQQLQESHRTNLSLTSDLHKLTIDWEHLRDEMSHKEDEWKEEEQVNDLHISFIRWSTFHPKAPSLIFVLFFFLFIGI